MNKNVFIIFFCCCFIFICNLLFSSTSFAYQWIQNTNDPWGSFASTSYSRPVFADINTDGHVDILIATSDGDITLYLGDGEGNYTLNTTILGYLDINTDSSPVVYDFDEDGYNDILLPNSSYELTVYYVQPDGRFHTTYSTIIDSTIGNHVYSAVSDLNADGEVDIYYGEGSTAPTMYTGDGLGTYTLVTYSSADVSTSLYNTLQQPFSETHGSIVPTIGDINDDDNLDIIYGCNHGYFYIYLGDGEGNYTRDTSVVESSIGFHHYAKPVIADINRDGVDDLILGTNTDGVMLYSGYETGTLTLEDTFDSSLVGMYTAVSVNDIDADCDNDVMIGSADGNVYVFAFDGDDDDETVDEYSEYMWYQDSDGDGYGNPSEMLYSCTQPEGYVSDNTDCNDTTASAQPGAEEICDGIDNDCDGTIDGSSAVDALTWYHDADSDGYGNVGDTIADCTAPTGYISDHTDCDDTRADINPSATEICDSIDNDCNGSIDDLATTDLPKWYYDEDHDGYGLTSSEISSCSQPTGYVSLNNDCNDSDASINPAATEICGDAIDNDCDGIADVPEIWYLDSDSDGYGSSIAPSFTACGATVPGYVTNDTDCNDSDATINPTATEFCDGIDNNCDGSIDEASASDATDWYIDADSDTYGSSSATPVHQCYAPAGYVGDNSDCDDSSSATYPAASETCDGNDNDCNGIVDDADPSVMPLWYYDYDADGYGNPATSQRACSAPDRYVADNTDCDDDEETINPGGTELCNGDDDDCDGRIDIDAVDGTTYYADSDEDGYGDPMTTSLACTQPDGYIEDNTDCDDGSAAINPSATEVCDGLDNNCDSIIDTGATDETTWYLDADGDLYGDNEETTLSCSQPEGYIADNTDCDDSEASTHPNGDELCDGIDNDCDGSVDEEAIDMATFYADADGDGYGNPSITETACSASSGYVSDATDCNDSEASAHPGLAEVCADAIDNDCDGSVDEFCAGGTDYDDDGDGATEDDGDCDDGNASVFPGATELCNGIDDNCNGEIDSDATDKSTFFADIDGDGYGNLSITETACSASSGYVSDATDCNDNDAAINPGATEICDDQDNNCNGEIDSDATDMATWYADADEDGYGDPSLTEVSCEQPDGYVADGTDCDDATSLRHPGLSEICVDDIDNDCDDDIDEGCAGEPDEDDDGDGYTEEAGDCDDGDEDSYPGALERCDEMDNDCDGEIDEACVSETDIDDDGDGQTEEEGDCDDDDDTVYTGATEICDLKDNDCNTTIDDVDASLLTTWYFDKDEDGYGTASTSQQTCFQPTHYVANDTDCDDMNVAINPAAEETCDDIDNDCDGSVDEEAIDMATFYADADGDGYGNPSITETACSSSSGYVSDATDCNDSEASAHPGLAEVCADAIDNDCDGSVDEDCSVETSTEEDDTTIDDETTDDGKDIEEEETASVDDSDDSDQSSEVSPSSNNQNASSGGCSLNPAAQNNFNIAILLWLLLPGLLGLLRKKAVRSNTFF